MAKLVIDDDGTKFTDSHLWATVHNEVSESVEIPEILRRAELCLRTLVTYKLFEPN